VNQARAGDSRLAHDVEGERLPLAVGNNRRDLRVGDARGCEPGRRGGAPRARRRSVALGPGARAPAPRIAAGCGDRGSVPPAAAGLVLDTHASARGRSRDVEGRRVPRPARSGRARLVRGRRRALVGGRRAGDAAGLVLGDPGPARDLRRRSARGPRRMVAHDEDRPVDLVDGPRRRRSGRPPHACGAVCRTRHRSTSGAGRAPPARRESRSGAAEPHARGRGLAGTGGRRRRDRAPTHRARPARRRPGTARRARHGARPCQGEARHRSGRGARARSSSSAHASWRSSPSWPRACPTTASPASSS